MQLLDPLKLFRDQFANLCNAIEASPLRIANELLANELISPNIQRNVASMTGTSYDKASIIVGEMWRKLGAAKSQDSFLRRICEFLLLQADKTLRDIGDSMIRSPSHQRID